MLLTLFVLCMVRCSANAASEAEGSQKCACYNEMFDHDWCSAGRLINVTGVYYGYANNCTACWKSECDKPVVSDYKKIVETCNGWENCSLKASGDWFCSFRTIFRHANFIRVTHECVEPHSTSAKPPTAVSRQDIIIATTPHQLNKYSISQKTVAGILVSLLVVIIVAIILTVFTCNGASNKNRRKSLTASNSSDSYYAQILATGQEDEQRRQLLSTTTVLYSQLEPYTRETDAQHRQDDTVYLCNTTAADGVDDSQAIPIYSSLRVS